MRSSFSEKRAAGPANKILISLFRMSGMLVFMLLLFFLAFTTPSFAMKLLGTYDFGYAGNDSSPATSSFAQRYRASQNLQLDPTDAISSTIDLSYYWSQNSSGQTNEMLMPTAGVGIANEFFDFGLSGSFSRIQGSTGSRQDYSSWEATLSNQWKPRYFPIINLYYGGSETTRTLSSEESFGTSSSNYGGTASWIFRRLGELNYRIDQEIAQANDSSSEQKRLTQGGSYLFSRKNLFHSNLDLKFRQSISSENVEISVQNPGDSFERQLQFSAVYAARADIINMVEVAGLNVVPTVPPPVGTPPLVTVPPDDPLDPGKNIWQFGVMDIFDRGEQQLEQINVYVDDPDGRLAAALPILGWELQQSSLSIGDINNPLEWTPVPGFNPLRDVKLDSTGPVPRLEIAVPVLDTNSQSLRLVVHNNDPDTANGFTLGIRALSGSRFIVTNPGETTFSETLNTSTSELNLRWRITRRLFAASNLIREESGSYLSRRVNGNLGMSLSRYFSPSVNFSQTTNTSNTSESISRNYGVNVSSLPLSTLALNFQGRRIENFNSSYKTASEDRYVLHSYLRLYQDLDSSLTVSYRDHDNLRRDGSIISSDRSLASYLTLEASLLPSLRARLTSTYGKNFEPVSDPTATSLLELYFRPSDYLSMGSNIQIDWMDQDSDSFIFSATVGLFRARKSRLDLQFQHSQRIRGNINETISLLGNWNLSKHFWLRGFGHYTIAESGTNDWSIASTVYVSF